MTPSQRRIRYEVRYLVYEMLILFGIVGALLGLGAWVHSCKAEAQEVQPQTIVFRLDNVDSQEKIIVLLRCGRIMRPFLLAEPRTIVDENIPVVSLCDGGAFMLAADTWRGSVPLGEVPRLEREGKVGGLLLCIRGRVKTALLAYGPGVTLPICSTLDWRQV